ncbi:MAG: hypothetical protein E7044_00625 [Lentisphaerae bacterium]|nr:hypothetical protein [Lentisphaerota bacterium]
MKYIKLIAVFLCTAVFFSVFSEPVEQRIILFDSLRKSKTQNKQSAFYDNKSLLVYTDNGLLCGKGYTAPILKIPAERWDWSEGAIAFTLTPIDFESASMKKEFVLMSSRLVNHNKPKLGFKTGDTCMLLRMQRQDLSKPEVMMLQGQNGRMSDHRAYIAIANSSKGFFVKNKPARIAVVWRKGDEASIYLNGVKIGSGKPFYFPGPDKLRCVNLLAGGAKRGWGVLDGTAYMTDLLIVKGRTSFEELQLVDSGLSVIREKKTTQMSEKGNQTDALPVISFPPLKKAAKLDGQFDEYGFVCSGFIRENTGLLADFPCYFYTAADAKNIYMGIKCDWSKKTPYNPVSSAAVNDDSSLISSGDIACFFFRKVTQPGAKGYSGTYITIAPNNCVYDAKEDIDWSRNLCVRNKKFDSGVKTYSSYKNGIWSIEVVLPRKQNNLASDEFQFSAGVRLQNQSLHLKNHRYWFDNVDAFLTGRCIAAPLALAIEKQKTGWKLVTDGNAEYKVSLDKTQKVTKVTEIVADQIVGSISGYQTIENVQKISGKNLKQTIPFPPLGLYTFSYQAQAADGSILLSRQIPFLQRKDVELTLQNNPIAKKLKVKVEFPGITVQKGEVFTLGLQTKEGRQVLSKSITVPQDSPSELEFNLNTGSLALGNYIVKVCRGTVELAEKDYEVKPLPEWYTKPVAMKALKADYAPIPWQEGVTVKGGCVSVWGRKFMFGKRGLEKITSQGKTVLYAPVVLQYRKDGKSFQIIPELKEIQQLGKGRVLVRTEGQDVNFRCSIRHTIEFDGLDILGLEVHPQNLNCSVEKMELVLPVADGWQFQNWYGHCCQEFGYTKPRTFDRLIALWLGNDDCGLNTFFENHKGLYIDSRKPRIRLESVKGKRDYLYRLSLVNVPVQVNRPVVWRLGLHPTPIKPLYQNWEDERVAMFSYYRPPFNFISLHTYDYAANSTDFQPRNQKLGRDWGEMGKIHNQKIYPYVNPTCISKENMVRPDAPAFLPRMPDKYFYKPGERPQLSVGQEFGEDWSFQPASVYPGNGSRHNDRFYCSPASSFSDYAVWMMANCLKDGGFAGFYYDLTTPKENRDKNRGYLYETLDGKSEGTRELFATRDFYKRLYCAFASVKGDKYPTIFSHGYPILSGSASFWSLVAHGEEFKPRHLGGLADMLLVDRQIGVPLMSAPPSGAKRDYSGVLWRINFSPYRWGIPQAHLSQYCFLPKQHRTAKATRETLALCFVNNSLFDSAFIHCQSAEDFHLRVTMPFGMGGTEFHGYWKNGILSKPKEIKVSYWKKKGSRDWLVAVANWSQKDVTAEIVLPPELLNAAFIYNMETANRTLRPENVALPWKVRIPAMDLKVFRFTGAK